MSLESPDAVQPLVFGVPDWVEPFFRPRAGADPLGQQTITTDRIIGRLLPGILALTERARYFVYYSWLLSRYIESRRVESPDALSRYIKERESELAIAVRLCPRKCGLGPIGGSQVTPRYVQTNVSFERRESIESDYGGYGLYYGAPMNQLGLTARRGTLLGETPIQIDILRPEQHAQDLARHFAAAVANTRYVRDFMDGTGPIPQDVLVELSQRACLCRLDTFPDERAALRRVLFTPIGPQAPTDPDRRREGFAMFLELAEADGWKAYSDDIFRASIWRAFRRHASTDSPRGRTLSSWAALAAANYLHDGITLLWFDGCRRLRNSEPDRGYTRENLRVRIAELADGSFDLMGQPVSASAEEPTEAFIGRLHDLLPLDGDLPAMWQAAIAARTTLVGAALVLTTLTRLPKADATTPAWSSIAAIDGFWQDGLARSARRLAAHLATRPTVGETLNFLVDTCVIRPHIANATSKLPDFTFLFRRELGRLRFFHHYDPDFVRPGNIRAFTLAQLSRDLGLCEMRGDGFHLTADGAEFIAEVFGS